MMDVVQYIKQKLIFNTNIPCYRNHYYINLRDKEEEEKSKNSCKIITKVNTPPPIKDR